MLFFLGKRHDNKLSKLQIFILSRSFVVMAQAPIKISSKSTAFSNRIERVK